MQLFTKKINEDHPPFIFSSGCVSLPLPPVQVLGNHSFIAQSLDLFLNVAWLADGDPCIFALKKIDSSSYSYRSKRRPNKKEKNVVHFSFYMFYQSGVLGSA